VVRSAERGIALFHIAEDHVFTLRSRRRDKDGPLPRGIVFGCRVACPPRNCTIDLETGVAARLDEGCTGRQPRTLEGHEIHLLLRVLDAAPACG
jgi:nitrite reductase/ring-hydroxylating ferredoxin subunit